MKKYISALLCFIMLISFTLSVNAADEDTLNIAKELNKQGLLSGVSVDENGEPDFGLEQHLTRQQAATLLVKLLGAQEEAINGTWENGFTDVDSWAQQFVGYAYSNGIASGMRADYFGAKEYISASQYITFILKALGYSPATDFNWEKSWDFSDKLGITNGEYSKENNTAFLRADAIRITYATLLLKQQMDKGYIPEISEDTEKDIEQVSNEIVPETDQPVIEPEINNQQEAKPVEPEVPQEPEKPAVYEGDPNIVTEAKKYLGYPYVAGGKGPNGFDCSGFCIYVLKQCGYKITNAGSSQDLYNLSSRVSAADLKVGDLVFFKGTYATGKISHSGIYIGNGQMIHAGTTKTDVCIVNLNERYWVNHFYAYGRMSK